METHAPLESGPRSAMQPNSNDSVRCFDTDRADTDRTDTDRTDTEQFPTLTRLPDAEIQ